MTATPLISRKLLFGNPDRTQVDLSPDGKRLAWIAPLDGVLNVWVAQREDPQSAEAVTHDIIRGIRFYAWAHTNRHILYLQDQNGDENWRVFLVDLDTHEETDLTPFEGVQARILKVSPRLPNEIMLGLNNRDPQWHDVYRANIAFGSMELVEKNRGFAGYVIDDDYRLIAAVKPTEDGGAAIYTQDGRLGWEEWDFIPRDDMLTTDAVDVDKTGDVVIMKDSRGRNTSAVLAWRLDNKKVQEIASDSRSDAQDVLLHPTEKTVQAVSFVYERKSWKILDRSIEEDLAYLHTVADGELEIPSRSLADDFWVALFLVDDGPARYYLYDRAQREAHFLFSNRESLEGQPLVKMHSSVMKSRDGLDLIVYCSFPVGTVVGDDLVPNRSGPLVLIPHGGPWGRDVWGYDAMHQWVANRGYVALSVNFRSSTGLGKAFTNAGDREWGGKIIEDQIDAVNWAIAQGIADPAKVAVMGGSFGGYSTLAGLTFTPEVFACGVDIVGPSNLITLMETIPPYWKPMQDMFAQRVGDLRTEEGRALLKKHSPLTQAYRICRPLLIGQGAYDPRVKQAESDQIVSEMKLKGIPVTYVLYPDEGHGFARPENRLSFFAIAEAFLSKCLGGRHEPVGDDFGGSSLQILNGEEEVPGLTDALRSM